LLFEMSGRVVFVVLVVVVVVVVDVVGGV